MIDWLLNDILWGWGRKRAYVLTELSWGQGWVIAMPLNTLISGGRGDLDCCTHQFSRGFWQLYGSKYTKPFLDKTGK